MAYSTKDNVESEFKNVTFDATSKVTETEVDEFIAEADLTVDSFLSRRYVVPVTGVQTLILVRKFSRQLTAARCAPIIGVQTNFERTTNNKEEKSSVISGIMRHLKAISKGEADLPSDATLKPSKSSGRFVISSGETDKFDYDKDQW